MANESWVIYNRNNWKRMESKTRANSFANKSVATRILNKKAAEDENFDASLWKIDTYENWANSEPMVDTTSLMDNNVPKTIIKIRASEKGTASDPATERYWSA